MVMGDGTIVAGACKTGTPAGTIVAGACEGTPAGTIVAGTVLVK